MGLRLGGEVGDLDVAGRIAGYRDDLQPGHDGGGRVGAVGGHRNEADVAVRIAGRSVIVADGEQARIFALAAGVGLQRDRVEAGDLGEHRLELLEELLVALRLLERREGMHEGEARARSRGSSRSWR